MVEIEETKIKTKSLDSFSDNNISDKGSQKNI